MTEKNIKLCEIDRRVAFIIGAKKDVDGYWKYKDRHIGMDPRPEIYEPVFLPDVYETQLAEYWTPSISWEDAMFAAEEVGLFDGGAYLAKSIQHPWVVETIDRFGHAGGMLLGGGDTGPLAICNAIIGTFGEDHA